MKALDKRFLIWAVLALLAIVWMGVAVPCWADGDNPATDPGDPGGIPPGCTQNDSLEPTSGTLGNFWMILMAMAFQLAL